jgi:predicted transcriptional regulator
MNEIKEKRLEAGLTQEQLARLADVTTVTVNRAEKKGDMKLSTYRKIMQALTNATKSN